MIETIAPSQFKALKKPKKRKFRNVITFVDGIRFDSKHEAKRWSELNYLLKAGEISNLDRQVCYSIEVKNRHICNYIADFTYRDTKGYLIVEDAKSAITRKDPLYRLKKKLMNVVHNITIKEVL